MVTHTGTELRFRPEIGNLIYSAADHKEKNEKEAGDKQIGTPSKKSNGVAIQKTTKRATSNDEKPFFVVGIGASAGGLNAVSELASQLPADLNVAVLVVLHLSGSGSRSRSSDILDDRIQKRCLLTCKVAEDKEPIRAGYVYIASPDTHLVKD